MSYQTRVGRDLELWRQAGWVSEANAGAILADLGSRQRGFSLPQVLALLGGVLLCFGAMTFVASNWQAMSKLARLGLLAAGLWGSYGAAFAFFRRGQEAFGHTAVLVASGVFGAAIMLIAQMYHMDGHPPDAVLVWGMGTTLAGIALRSPLALVLAVALLGLWSGWEAGLRQGVHWAFLPAWLALTAASLGVSRWRPLFILLGLALAVWIVALAVLVPAGQGNSTSGHHILFEIPAIVGLVTALLAWIATPAIDPVVPVGRQTTAIMLASAYTGMWGLQFLHHSPRTGPSLAVLFVVSLVALVAAIVWALRTDNRPVLWLAYFAFSIEMVSIYFKTLGTLLNTSLFFLSAGLLVIGLSWIAWKLHSRAPVLAGGPLS